VGGAGGFVVVVVVGIAGCLTVCTECGGAGYSCREPEAAAVSGAMTCLGVSPTGMTVKPETSTTATARIATRVRLRNGDGMISFLVVDTVSPVLGDWTHTPDLYR